MTNFPQLFHLPPAQGLYDPQFEKDACGVGFIAHIKGERSHQIVKDSAELLRRMDHRGACGCEANTGDGAGVLTALPHEFLRKVLKSDLKLDLPAPGQYSAGNVFLPQDAAERAFCKAEVEKLIAEHHQHLLGWRPMPTDVKKADLGPSAIAGEPVIEQLFIAAGKGYTGEAFERQLYLIRKRASNFLRVNPKLHQAKLFYVCSLSTKVIIYKGMLTAEQLFAYYPDLLDEDYTSHLAMVHSRFATNTFPSWDRAQPLRFMSHNGEINTLRGNKNWMFARQGVLESDLFGEELPLLFPIAEPDCSDSGTFDNVLEFLLMSGRTLQEAMMMMVPEAWQNHETMSEAKRAFYEYHSALMEPWDGPASLAFTDGHYIGATLDRNGLRPSRYYLTHDDRVIMASEVGVVDVDPALIKEKGRLQPGRMFLVDFEQGKLISDKELKSDLATRRPYGEWLKRQRINLRDLQPNQEPHGFYPATLLERMQAFGYTIETMHFMLLPLIATEKDPLGSMGNDSCLAVLSDKPRMLYDYFRQLFAQVTNPPVDSIREEVIMSLECFVGPEQNLLETTEEHAHRLGIHHPILSNEQLASLKHIEERGWKTRTIDITWERSAGEDGLLDALNRVCEEAERAIEEGFSLIVLSDRAISRDRVPISALLATGAVHHHLVRQSKRTRLGIIVETGEAREVHHHCLLVGYGADAINPYLAFEALWQARRDGLLDSGAKGHSNEESGEGRSRVNYTAASTDGEVDDPVTQEDLVLVKKYRKGIAKGMLKVMAKMGISTLQSYKGAQIFEAIGLRPDVIDCSFAGTSSRIKGVGFRELAKEALRRHAIGYPETQTQRLAVLPNPGEFHWRSEGERHMWDPQSIADIQVAARTNSRDAYKRFAEHINHDSRTRCQLRGLLDFIPQVNGAPVRLDEVEPAAEIVKRFCTGAMSFGSISAEAHESLAVAMNRIGGKSNTGEGGEDPARWDALANGDSKRSAIKQVASGRFGVTISYLTNADELQIKIAQGAKPGEGGELPGRKVDANIARIRYSTPGVGLISPPPHHDIYSIEDLKQLIHDLKNANRAARISVKLVSEVGVGTIASGVAKGYADHIVIAGDGGGTGASPLTSIKHAGLPWELGIAEAHQTLVLNDLRSRVVLQTDGGLKTGRDVVMAAMLGAEEFGFATAPLITLGCIMMRKCHLNTCPVGVATQDPELRKKFTGKPEHVINYLFMVAEDAREIMASLGFRTITEMVGRSDCLDKDAAIKHWKADGLDLTDMLKPAFRMRPSAGTHCTQKQDHGLAQSLDLTKLLPLAQPAINDARQVREKLEIVNTNRTVGTILSNEIAKKWGEEGLPDGTINFRFTGHAGQSFGAFLAHGVTLELEGDANDYVAKGLSGGRVIVYPPRNAGFKAEENIIVGNVCLYGATRGEAFMRGRAAERFCVRNSGAHAVIEGVGDHGCEYMTGGRVVVLGPTGRNFAAGMSGGVAYVLCEDRDAFRINCNLGMVELENVTEPEDIAELRELVSKHAHATGSTVAQGVLENWSESLGKFWKVMPTDYKRVLNEQRGKKLVGAGS